MGSISLSFDPLATVIAFTALWIAYREASRNNRVSVKILKTGYSTGRGRDGFVRKFALVLRNQGISLHDPTVALNFRGEDGVSWVQIPLTLQRERTGEHSEFSRGMIAEFALCSSDVDDRNLDLYAALKDPGKQDAELIVYSQGYLATTFRVGGLRDRLAMKWNRFAHWFNEQFRYEKYNETWKSNVTGHWISLPTPSPKHFEIMMFIQELKKRSPSPGQGHTVGQASR